jgi:ADP-ribosylglycohydrolase
MLLRMRQFVADPAVARGCVLGLLLGDALGAVGGKPAPDAPMAATNAGQLACYTTEGIIRAGVRYDHKGICDPPAVVWHAYHRWATRQGITGVKRWGEDDPTQPWPDGWLAQVPALATRRGSAPATVAALRGGQQGSVEKPVGVSTGAHGLTRTLPSGLLLALPSDTGLLSAEIAALTHAGEAVAAAAVGAGIVNRLAEGDTIVGAAEHAQRECAPVLPEVAALPLAPALAAAHSRPWQLDTLKGLAPDARAASALAGGLYVAASCPPEPDRIREALLFAASAGDGGHTATVAGALLGTAHGVDALPVDLLARLELIWVGDTLARDLVREFTEHPSGSDHTKGPDPNWWFRYPGW